MSIEPTAGILDIRNAIVRVSKLEVVNATGLDTAINTIARNNVLLVDTLEQTTSNSWALKLPNAWVAEFDVSMENSGSIDFNFYNNATSGTNGYTLTLGDTTATIKYDGGSVLATGTIPDVSTGAYVKIHILFERDAVSVAVNGVASFYFKDTLLRPRVYDDAGGYINFFNGGVATRKLKNLKIVNEKWMSDDASNIAYVGNGIELGLNTKMYVGDGVVREFKRHDRPLTKYPEIKFSYVNADTTTQGGYTISSSQRYSADYPPSNVFDGNLTTISSAWISRYGGFTNPPFGSSVVTPANNLDTFNPGTGAINGPWLKFQLPSQIRLSHIRIYKWAGSSAAAIPSSGTIYASNDGSSFTSLTSFSGIHTSLLTGSYVFNLNLTQTYKYYVIHFTSVYTVTNSHYLGVQELEFYGHEEGDESVDVIHRSVPNKPGQQQLAVYWDANDAASYPGSGTTVTDLSGNGRTGTLTNGVGFDSTYNAFTFDGVDDTISGTLSNPAGDWVHSVSCWVSATELSSSKARFITYYGVEALRQQVILGLKSQQVYVDFNSDSIFKDVSPFLLNTWYHIAFTYPGGGTSRVKIYINGVDIGASGGGTTALNIAINRTLYIGKQLNSYNDPWKGSIANFRLYSKVLNADQVRELYEYDAERFGHRTNAVALHKGNLGVGVAQPTARLEVAGADGLQEYPPQWMTGYETYMEGHGVFRASASNIYDVNHQPWEAFGEYSTTVESIWNTPDSLYNTTTGAYTGYVTTEGLSGEWLQLEIPYKIKLSSFNLNSYADAISNRQPRDFVLFGSNDGSTWETLKSVFNQTSGYTIVDPYAASGGGPSHLVNATEYYKFFRIVVRSIQASNDGIAAIGRLRFFGTPAPSSLEDGHLTLGKALTAPRLSGHAAGAETPRAESLVVHYDTTVDSVVAGTTVVDTSGNGLNGTLTNGTAYSSSERALTFDGVNDYVSGTLPSTATGAWVHSVSFWFKLDSVVDDRYFSLIGGAFGGTPGSAFLCLIYNNSLTMSVYTSEVISATDLVTNTWYHATFVYRGGTFNSTNVDIYLNGVKETTTQNNPITPNLASQSLSIGLNNNSNYYLDGSISNFKIWNIALTADEVAAEYALGRTGKSINITDTAVCLGGRVPRAQLDVRGSARFGNVGINTSPAGNLHVRDSRGNETPATIILQPSSNQYSRGYTKIEGFHDAVYGSGAGLRFFTREDSGTDFAADSLLYERMRISSAGNVGIGTVSPSNTLHIHQIASGSTPILRVQATDSGRAAYAAYLNSSGTAAYCGLDGAGLFEHSTGALALGTNNTPIIFSPNFTTGMKAIMTTDGKFGIGTASPLTGLDVNGSVWSRGALRAGAVAASEAYFIKKFTSGVNVDTLTLDFTLASQYRGGIVKAWLTSGVSGDATVATWSRKVSAFSWKNTSVLAETVIEDEEQHPGNSITITMPSNGTLRVTGTMYSSFSYPMMEVEVTYAGGITA
ncbi:hypothetical protein [Dishui Lake phycodnavirus 3]|nr:hypothetical protein [Dishui Lake phycodnavirus 3]